MPKPVWRSTLIRPANRLTSKASGRCRDVPGSVDLTDGSRRIAATLRSHSASASCNATSTRGMLPWRSPNLPRCVSSIASLARISLLRRACESRSVSIGRSLALGCNPKCPDERELEACGRNINSQFRQLWFVVPHHPAAAPFVGEKHAGKSTSGDNFRAVDGATDANGEQFDPRSSRLGMAVRSPRDKIFESSASDRAAAESAD